MHRESIIAVVNQPSGIRIAIAGLLAGLAVTFEFQTGLVGMVLLGYALSRKTGRADARPRVKGFALRSEVGRPGGP